VRVSPDRQTLILAGETLPGRSVVRSGGTSVLAARSGANSQRVTIVTEGEYTPSAEIPDTAVVAYDAIDPSDLKSDPALPATLPRSSWALTSRPYSSSSRGGAFGGAGAYAATQDLVDRHPLIDTYA
jgi:hypothetical protein